jgi:hypothetical protein
MPRTPDTSWHPGFLDRVKGGMPFIQAIRSLGITERTLYNHFREDAYSTRPHARPAPLRA